MPISQQKHPCGARQRQQPPWPSHRMDLLLLLLVLLCSYFHPDRLVSSQTVFTMGEISLWVEPSAEVPRDTDVTLRCRVPVSSSEQAVLNRQYTIYRGSSAIVTKTSNTSDDFLHLLPRVRFFNSGKYRCAVKIEETLKNSNTKKLTVTGLSTPVLSVDKVQVNEGEEITAKCSAPGETGSIFFSFYSNATELAEKQEQSDRVEVKVHLGSAGLHQIHCRYTVMLSPDTFGSQDSNISNSVNVSVTELPIEPVLVVAPEQQIFEGDTLSIDCSISGLQWFQGNVSVFLSQANHLLAYGTNRVQLSLLVRAGDTADLECTMEVGRVTKAVSKRVPVGELFSAPRLTLAPSEVFQEEPMMLTCRSDRFAPERLRREDLTYSLVSVGHLLQPGAKGVFVGKSPSHDFNYTCEARAKGLSKSSPVLTVRPKVAASVPRIWVKGRAILGRPVRILCQSDSGSPPINYTLLRGWEPVDTVSVQLPSQQAEFTVAVSSSAELSRLTCEARNNPREAPRSPGLDALVVEPLTEATLTVIPDPADISEGDHLILICGVNGTPPITFKWFRSGQETPLHAITVDKNTSDFQIQHLSQGHSDSYHCQALNYANLILSPPLHIQVRLALWKKALIGGVCLLAALVLALVCVLYCRFRGRRAAAAELSVKPSSPKSDDSVNLSRHPDAVSAAAVRVDRVEDSMWSKRPPEDEETGEVGEEGGAFVKYTEVLHPQPGDSARVPLRRGRETVSSELHASSHGAAGTCVSTRLCSLTLSRNARSLLDSASGAEPGLRPVWTWSTQNLGGTLRDPEGSFRASFPSAAHMSGTTSRPPLPHTHLTQAWSPWSPHRGR